MQTRVSRRGTSEREREVITSLRGAGRKCADLKCARDTWHVIFIQATHSRTPIVSRPSSYSRGLKRPRLRRRPPLSAVSDSAWTVLINWMLQTRANSRDIELKITAWALHHTCSDSWGLMAITDESKAGTRNVGIHKHALSSSWSLIVAVKKKPTIMRLKALKTSISHQKGLECFVLRSSVLRTFIVTGLYLYINVNKQKKQTSILNLLLLKLQLYLIMFLSFYILMTKSWSKINILHTFLWHVFSLLLVTVINPVNV